MPLNPRDPRNQNPGIDTLDPTAPRVQNLTGGRPGLSDPIAQPPFPVGVVPQQSAPDGQPAAPDGQPAPDSVPSIVDPSSPLYDPYAADRQALEQPQTPAENPLAANLAPEPQKGLIGEAVTGVKRGLDQTKALMYGLEAFAGDVAGVESIRKQGILGYEQSMKDAALQRPAVEKIEDIKSAGDFVTWAVGKFGEFAPTIASMVVTAGVGGLAARALYMGLISKSEKAAVEAGSRVALRKLALATEAGQAASTFAGGAALGTGSIYAELDKQGKANPAVALGFGAAEGALYSLPFMRLATKFGVGKEMQASITRALIDKGLLTRVGQKAEHGITRRIAGGAGAQFALQGSTMALASVIDEAAKAYVDENRKLFTPEQMSQYLNAFVAGGVIGAVAGGAAGIKSQETPATALARDLNKTIAKTESDNQAIRDQALAALDPKNAQLIDQRNKQAEAQARQDQQAKNLQAQQDKLQREQEAAAELDRIFTQREQEKAAAQEQQRQAAFDQAQKQRTAVQEQLATHEANTEKAKAKEPTALELALKAAGAVKETKPSEPKKGTPLEQAFQAVEAGKKTKLPEAKKVKATPSKKPSTVTDIFGRERPLVKFTDAQKKAVDEIGTKAEEDRAQRSRAKVDAMSLSEVKSLTKSAGLVVSNRSREELTDSLVTATKAIKVLRHFKTFEELNNAILTKQLDKEEVFKWFKAVSSRTASKGLSSLNTELYTRELVKWFNNNTPHKIAFEAPKPKNVVEAEMKTTLSVEATKDGGVEITLPKGQEKVSDTPTPEQPYTMKAIKNPTAHGPKVKVTVDTKLLSPKEATAAKTAEKEVAAIGSKPGILANRVSNQMKTERVGTLIGQKANSHQDLATMAQVYRNQRFEVGRLIFTDKDGNITHETGMSARMPGRTKLFPTGKWDAIKQLIQERTPKGGKFFMMHNHPSGEASPSQADMQLTGQISERFGKQFGGHVILDTDHFYSLVRGSSGGKTLKINRNELPPSKPLDPSKPHPLLGAKIKSPIDIAEAGALIKAPEGNAVVIGDTRSGVSGIGTIPLSLLADTAKAKKFLRGFGVATGSTRLSIVEPHGARPKAFTSQQLSTAYSALHDDGFISVALSLKKDGAIAGMTAPKKGSAKMGSPKDKFLEASDKIIPLKKATGKETNEAGVIFETVPSTAVDPNFEIGKAGFDEVQKYSIKMAEVIAPKGHDEILDILGVPQTARTPDLGSWEGTLSPNVTANLFLRKKGIAHDTEIADLYSAAVGYIYSQDAVIWELPNAKEPGIKSLGVSLRFPEVPSRQTVQKIYDHVRSLVPSAELTRTGKYIKFLNLRFGGDKPPISDTLFRKGLQKALNTLPFDAEIEDAGLYKAITGAHTHDWSKDPKGETYLARIRKSGRSDLLKYVIRKHKEANALRAKLTERFQSGTLEEPETPFEERDIKAIHDTAKRSERVRIAQSEGLDLLADGKIELSHYSRARLTSIDPTYHGSGIKGAEAKRKAAEPETYVDRTYYGLPGYKKEVGLGPIKYTVDIPMADLYPLKADPDNLKRYATDPLTGKLNINRYEQVVRNIGYDGYYVGKVAAVFKTLTPKTITENGETTPIHLTLDEPALEFEDRTYDLDQVDAMNKAGFGKISRKSFGDRVREFFHRFGLKIQQGVFDRFATVREYSEKAWMLMHLTPSATGAMEGAFLHGKLKLGSEGVLTVDTVNEGLIHTLAKLRGETDDFFMWMAANRAKQLAAEGKERLLNDTQIEALRRLNSGRMADGSSRAQVYEQVRKDFLKFHNSILDIAEKTGMIGKEERATWNNDFYVPFFRLMEEEVKTHHGPANLDGMTGQTAIRKLKGVDKPLADILGNVLINWHHLISSSLKNQAATRAIEAAERMGAARRVSKVEKTKSAVYIRKNGKKQYVEISDPLLLEAVTQLSWDGFSSHALRMARKFKRAFTIGVTAAPAFRVANLLRDTIQAVATTPASYNVLKNVLIDGRRGTKANSLTRARMLVSGGEVHFGHILGLDPEGVKIQIQKLEHENGVVLHNAKAYKKAWGAIRGVWDKWTEFGSRIENVNRAAIYQQQLRMNKGELRAAFEARDLLDFSRYGALPAVRMLVQVVPFLNARLQGLDKLGRAATEQHAKFTTATLAYSAAAVALYLHFRDDEDFKKREQWDRDTYLWFKLPGSETQWRVPIPFEVGMIGNMFVRTVEQATDDDVHGELFADRLKFALTQTLSFSAIPQLVKPAYDVYANYNPFTERSIESAGIRNLPHEDRKKSWTSETAIELAKGYDSIVWDSVKLSPIQMEYLVRGYLGWAGATTLGAMDTLLTRPLTGAPSRPLPKIDDYPLIGRFIRTGVPRSTRFISEFYKTQEDISRMAAKVNMLKRIGEDKKAMEVAVKNRDLLRWKTVFGRIQRDLSKLNKMKAAITASRKLSPAEKALQIDQINQIRNLKTQYIIEFKTKKERGERK